MSPSKHGSRSWDSAVRGTDTGSGGKGNDRCDVVSQILRNVETVTVEHQEAQLELDEGKDWKPVHGVV